MPDLRFHCPRCGGSSFGSVLDPKDPKGPMHRYCHGNAAGDGIAGCKFNWPNIDDWKHFLVDGVRLDIEEYAAVEAKIRSMSVIGLGPDCPFPEA